MVNREKYFGNNVSNEDFCKNFIDICSLVDCGRSKKKNPMFDCFKCNVESKNKCSNFIIEVSKWLSKEYEDTSEKMFDRLGYVKYSYSNMEEKWSKDNTNIVIFKDYQLKKISFSKFFIYYDGNSKEFLEARKINTDEELKAILQRIKEIKEDWGIDSESRDKLEIREDNPESCKDVEIKDIYSDHIIRVADSLRKYPEKNPDLNNVIETIKMIHAFNRDLDIYYSLHNEKSPYKPSLGLDEEDRKKFDCGKYTVYVFENRNSQKPYKSQGHHVHILNLSDADAKFLNNYCIKEGYVKTDRIIYDRGPHND